MRFLYNLFIQVYRAFIFFVSPFNTKAKKWITGRKNIYESIESKLSGKEKIIWFHCASLGEFEQGRPLIEKFKVQSSKFKVLLTFFSPSGYEIRKNYTGADYVFYLPLDTPSNAKKFISIVKPQAAFFIKYEFWFNYLNELKKNNIPTFLISGVLRNDHYFFKWYGNYFLKQLKCFTHFFMQDENSKKLLEENNYTNITVSGDTRFDRVFELKEKAKKIDLIEKFKGDSKLLIAGSTWEEDETLIYNSIKNFKLQTSNFKLVIAPHEIHESHIKSIEKKFSEFRILRYSLANETNITDKQIIIIDSIGLLSSIYQYGDIAFVGGGFGKGIHNILEAATFGLPVFFGPNYKKFNEAKDLINTGGAFCIEDEKKLADKTSLLFTNNNELIKASRIAEDYVKEKKGATEIILNHIKKYISL